MDNKIKQQIVDESIEKLKALKDNIEHPEGALILAHLNNDKGRITITGASIGCVHGIENALVEGAIEDPKLAEAIFKAAKELKSRGKEERPDIEEMIQEMFAGSGIHAIPINLDDLFGKKRKGFKSRLEEEAEKSRANAKESLDRLEKSAGKDHPMYKFAKMLYDLGEDIKK